MSVLTFSDPGHRGNNVTQTDLFTLQSLQRALPIGTADSIHFSFRDTTAGFFDTFDFTGSFSNYANGRPAVGTVTGVVGTDADGVQFTLSGINAEVSLFFAAATPANLQSLWTAIVAGGDRVTGTPSADVFDSGPGADTVDGGAGGDSLSGGTGDDILTGGSGNDRLDGGDGNDIAVYSGARANYTITPNPTGYSITDNRAGSPDGTDSLLNVERLSFSDQTTLVNGSAAIDSVVASEIASVLRGEANRTSPTALSATLSAGLASGSISQAQALQQIIVAAENTSSVATLAYEFFTGKAPSAAGMDFLVSPTGPNPNNLNAAYYQSFSLENRYINFAVNLGKVGEGNAAFTAAYGNLSLFEATRKAYATIFGEAPSDTKLHAILDPTTVLNGVTFTRSDYFAYYGQDGANGIGTKAAMVGYLLAEAEKADLGVYAKSNDAFLTDVALHNAPFGVDLIGVYNQPGFVFHPG